jgi:hypothetical protein
MRQTNEMLRTWCRTLAVAWRTRRDEVGGVTDDTAMMGLLAVAAVTVGGIIFALVTGAANNINLGF